MRFIFGLLAGALSTLMVAAALDAPADDVFAQVQESWRTISTEFAGQNDDRGSAAPMSLSQPPATLEQTALAETLAPAPAPAGEPSETEVQQPWRGPREQQEPASDQTGAEHGERLLDPLVANQPGEAQVWAPFHSEASANGFANRLTRQLAHPFQVRKLGPAEYVVVYAYADENQHLSLQQRIAAVTGASSS